MNKLKKIFSFGKIKEQEINKILILRFSSIGDIVLTTPIVRCIKRSFPNAEIHYFTKKPFAKILEANPNIDVVHQLNDNIGENIKELKALNFDAVVDLHHNLRTLRVKKALGVKKTYSFPKLNIKKWLYVRFEWNLMPSTSIVERYFQAATPLGVVDDGLGLDFFIPEEQEIDKDDIPMGHWMGYVACVIGGSFATKQFPENKWKEFVNLCPYPIILLGGPEDRNLGELITKADPVKVYNACGKFNLMESADLVRKARVVISNDTGLMHITAAFQKPLISLWGNTTPWFGMFPYYGGNDLEKRINPKFSIIEKNGLSCRPCSKIGFDKCPKGHFDCMQKIEVLKIINDLKTFWNQ
ncbi:MAG TPA: glycosyltransferase family 9 protein [Edaphocola sp.]|nr:glycosyltransferase family 9 protein [Edaphocola sp.]